MSLLELNSKSLGPIGFGGASIAGESGGYAFGDMSEDKALGVIREAFDKGIRLFDSAPIYGFGESERRLGLALKKKREQVFLTSKSGVTWHENKRVDMTNAPEVTQKMLEDSLRSFDSDYIDLFMIHWPDSKIDIRFPMEVLAKAKEQGKIRYIGLCNSYKEDYLMAKEVAPIDALQSEFNLFAQYPLEGLFPYSGETFFQSWGTLDKGILSGKVTKAREQAKDYDEKDVRKKAPWWNQKEVLKKVEQLEGLWPILKEEEITPLEFAISYNLSFENVSQVLVGMKNTEQIDSSIEAANNAKPLEVVQRVLEKWQTNQ